MIFLGNNVLIEHDLTFEDIKPRLLGKHFPRCFLRELTDFVQAIGGRVQA